MIYATLSSLVFVGTLLRRRSVSDAAEKVQNLCGGVALGLSLLAMHTFAWRGLRVFGAPEEVKDLMNQMASNQLVLMAIIALSVTIGLVSHSGNGRTKGIRARRRLDLPAFLP